MKVKLINVAEYDLKDGKTTDVPFNTFVNLCGGINASLSEDLPKVRLFKTMSEFMSLSDEEIDEINEEETIKVLPNGQFLVFLKKNKKKEKAKSIKENATANTEENTAK